MSSGFSHIDAHNHPTMVDVGDKAVTTRTATARCLIKLPDVIKNQWLGADIESKKGPVIHTAIIAGVMAAKRTHELIPFCHPLGLENCRIHIEADENQDMVVSCTCRVSGKTGVEMEALTGASVAALTVYDMCKALSHDMVISSTQLIQKSGGKSDFNNSI